MASKLVKRGKAALPPTAPPDRTVYPVDLPDLKIDDARVAAGAAAYGRCAMCRGVDMQSTGTAPDLRESQAALSPATLKTIVRGALKQSGMPGFSNFTDQEIEDIYVYIRAGARAQKNGKAFVAGTGGMCIRRLQRILRPPGLGS